MSFPFTAPETKLTQFVNQFVKKFQNPMSVKGISSVIATLLMMAITISLTTVAYAYISGVITVSTNKNIAIADATCNANNNYIISVRNLDPTNPIALSPNSEIKIRIGSITATGVDWASATSIDPNGGIATATVTNPAGGASGTSQKIILIGPSNSEQAVVLCQVTTTSLPPPPPPSTFDFSISLNPTSDSVLQGSSRTTTITLNLISGTAESVSLSYSGCPGGANCFFSPTSCSPACSSTFTVATTDSTPQSTYDITLTGTDGSQTHSRTYSLTVTPAPISVSFQYVRWEITKRKGSADSIQASEFVLLLDGNTVAWPIGTIATNLGGSNPGNEGPDKTIDSATSTKWLDFNFNFADSSSQTGLSILQINAGSGNSVTFNGYRWATANDAMSRDPISWNVYGSDDGSNWILLDSRTDEPITNSRNTFTGNYGISTTAPSTFDFSISLANPLSGSANQGGSTPPSTITTTLISGTTQPVSFNCTSGLPSGALCSFSPVGCSPTCSSTLTISTSPTTPTGTSTVTIEGTSGSKVKLSGYILTVNPPSSSYFFTVGVSGLNDANTRLKRNGVDFGCLSSNNNGGCSVTNTWSSLSGTNNASVQDIISGESSRFCIVQGNSSVTFSSSGSYTFSYSCSTVTPTYAVSVGKAQINYSDVQTWSANGLPPNAAYRITLRWPGVTLSLGTGTANSAGQASGSFVIGNNLPNGNITLRVELLSDITKYGERTFAVVLPCATPQLPTTIYSSGKFNWVIRKPTVYCDYINHKADVEAFFPLPDKLRDWYATNLGGAERVNFNITFVLDSPGGGYASGQEFGVAADSFWNFNNGLKGWWGYQLTAHEFGNLWTGNTISAGWPCDWWADHGACPAVPGFESPAPASFANAALAQINWNSSAQVAQDFYNSNKNDVLFIMFRDQLIGQYGSQMFKRAFDAVREDAMQWPKIDNGKNPGALLTNYVAAYLTIGAGTDLSPIFNSRANQPYPAGMTGFNSTAMNDIISARNLIKAAEAQGKCVSKAWEQYRAGNYSQVASLIGVC